MTNAAPRRNPLYELELEVLEEGREWMRRRLEQKLQKIAQSEGRLSPPERPAAQKRPLPSVAPAQRGRRA